MILTRSYNPLEQNNFRYFMIDVDAMLATLKVDNVSEYNAPVEEIFLKLAGIDIKPNVSKMSKEPHSQKKFNKIKSCIENFACAE